MKTTTSLPVIAGAAALLLSGCQTPNKQNCGPFPNDYENIVRNYVTPTFKHPDSLEWRAITSPRQGSLWRGLLFGGADPCWLVDVTLDEKNGSQGYVACQRTIYIKNDHVIGSRAFHPDGEHFITVGRSVTVQELSKMPPFEAVVESVDIEHPYFVSTTVHIWLKRTDGGKHMDLVFDSAKQSDVGFARSLHLGQTYSFPQALGDYVTSLSTDASSPTSISR